DFHSFKHTAIRYWERRRIIYNLLLAPPSLCAYFLLSDHSAGVGDRERFGIGTVTFLFLANAAGANICYSMAYALEFLIGSDEPDSCWSNSGRTGVLIAGILFAMLLSFWTGRNIAIMQYSFM